MLAAMIFGCVPRAFQAVMYFMGRLGQQKQAASDQDDVPPGHNLSSTVNHGWVSPITHEIEKSRPRRVSIARLEPHPPGEVTLVLGKTTYQDRDENDVINT